MNRRIPYALASVLLLYSVLQVLWVTASPLQIFTLPDNLPQGGTQSLLVGMGPDEKQHYLYILSLANRGEIPMPTPQKRTSPAQYVSYQAQHPPLFYLLGAVVYRISKNLSAAATWYVLRGVCSVCGLFVIILSARAARIGFPENPLLGMAMAPFVAFLPMFGYMMGNLSNEPLAAALGAWVWLQLTCLARARAELSVGNGMKLGLTLGLAAMSRLTALLWIPAVVIVLLFCVRRLSTPRRFLPLLACGAAFFLIITPWFVHNELAFGSLFIRSENRPLLEGQTFLTFLFGPDAGQIFMATVFWYASTAWQPTWLVQFYLPGGVRSILGWQAAALLLESLAAAALCLHAVREKSRPASADPAGRSLIWAAGAAIAFCILAVFQQELYSDYQIIFYGGRYFMDAVPVGALICLLAVSVNLRGAAKRLRAMAAIIAVLMFLFDVYTLLLVKQFYVQHPTLPAVLRL